MRFRDRKDKPIWFKFLWGGVSGIIFLFGLILLFFKESITILRNIGYFIIGIECGSCMFYTLDYKCALKNHKITKYRCARFKRG